MKILVALPTDKKHRQLLETACPSGEFVYAEGDYSAEYIKDAAIHGWIRGYGDGSFRASASITRAEAVTIINRLLGRVADEDYIDAKARRLNTFTDMDPKHWAYYAVMEAANAHTATYNEGESWMK